jgi:hypothetical protein
MRIHHWLFFALATTLLPASASAQRGEPPPLPAPIRQDRAAPATGYEVQTRGPVHEAFLEPTETLPQPRVVRQQPPGEILEAPAEERPDNGVVWVSGYWAWDDETNRYVWVSGVWRVPPPDKVWLPGRWQNSGDGWQWVKGAWLSAEEEQMQLLPPPPPPQQERAPELATGQIFVPGTWVYRGSQYVWRPGFPLTIPAGWVWSNARYINTPAGSLFAEGYWDLPLQDRWLLFSPVVFPNAAVGRSIQYLPQYVVPAASLLGALFVNTRTSQYYFGDYFEPRYQQAGYVPWLQYRVRDGGMNPLFGYYRQYGERGWIESMQGLYAARYSGAAPRPARTWVQQEDLLRRHGGRERIDQLAVVSSLDQYAGYGKKLKKVAPDERTYYQQTAQGYAAAAQQFQRFEQEYIAQRRAVPVAPVIVPFQPWPQKATRTACRRARRRSCRRPISRHSCSTTTVSPGKSPRRINLKARFVFP